jgi:hypothetical protein
MEQDEHTPDESTLVPSELEVMLNEGWTRRECGGQGDCGYLVITQGLHWNQNNDFLDPAAAQRQASNLRADAFQHIKKPAHIARFRAGYAADPSSDERFESFDSWLDASAKKGAWIDGMQTQAICERLGQVLIVWSADVRADGTISWNRYTHAPKFSQGFACQAKKSSPITMTLESGHYKLLVPPEGAKYPTDG